jgi:hypothetical protein
MKFIGKDEERSVQESLMSYLPKYYENSTAVNEIMRVDAEELERLYNEIANVLNQRYILTADTSLDRWMEEFDIKPPGLILITTTELIKANFLNKVEGSTVENPHIIKSADMSSLQSPNSGLFSENSQGTYDNAKALDGSLNTRTINSSGLIAQQLFSFNIIAEIERKYNWQIPGATTADKVQWLKDHLNKLTVNWYGKGSDPSGNRATIAPWRTDNSSWGSSSSHTSSSITKLSFTNVETNSINKISNAIDDNGFFHVIAYAEASDGITASTISTDFIELEIEFRWERYENYQRTDDEKRSLLMLQLRSRGTVTKQLLKEMCMIYDGGEVDIIEDVANYKLTIRFTSVFGVPMKIQDLTIALRNILPAHLDFEYQYRYSTWNEIDAENLTWNIIDSKQLLWNDVDNGGLL